MVSVQNKDAVQGALEHGVDHIIFTRIAKHHAQKVTRIAQFVSGVKVGLANAVFVSHGDQGGHFGNQADG